MEGLGKAKEGQRRSVRVEAKPIRSGCAGMKQKIDQRVLIKDLMVEFGLSKTNTYRYLSASTGAVQLADERC